MKYPARLVPFEKLMYFLDQPNCPNSLGIRLRFHGRLDRTAALAAAEVAFARHPGFQVTVDPERVQFVDRGEPFRNFRWIERATDDQPYQMKPTDIHRDGGAVIWFVVGPNESHVTLIGNHTLGDGIGGLQVTSDWILEYDRLLNGGKSKLPKLDPSRLADRGRLNLLNRKFLSKLIYQPIALFGASKFLFRRIVPLLVAPEFEPRPLVEYPCIETRRISSDQTEQLKSHASDLDVTLNDLIATAMFLALARWRPRHTSQRHRDWIRLLIPLSIRTFADRRLTACNRVSFVQIDRQPRQMNDHCKLLSGIARELRVIRQWQLDRTLLLALRLGSLIPGQLKRLASKPRNRGTMLLTILGNPFDRLPLTQTDRTIVVGNMRMFSFDMLAPLLRGMPIAVAVAEFQGELSISVNFDLRFVSQAQAAGLLDDLLHALQNLLEESVAKSQ